MKHIFLFTFFVWFGLGFNSSYAADSESQKSLMSKEHIEVSANSNQFLISSKSVGLKLRPERFAKRIAKRVVGISPIDETPNIQGLALAGFIVGLVGLIAFGIPLGITALVLSAIGLTMIQNHPEKYRGKGFGIAGFLLGILDIAGALWAISMMETM